MFQITEYTEVTLATFTWCQQQIDDWVARHVVLAASPQPPTQQEGSDVP